jgi:hypothetical protein
MWRPAVARIRREMCRLRVGYLPPAPHGIPRATMTGTLGSDPYALEIARAWRDYSKRHPFVVFYQFAVAFKAGWDANNAGIE